MKKVSGDIALMSLPDIMQWAETNKKTGTLTIKNREISKMFYLQNGKIIFVSSQKEGERLGEFFTRTGRIAREKIEAALRESNRLGIPFTGYLITEKIIDRETLEKVIEQLAELAFTDALEWTDGTFEFNDVLPAIILNGPVMLNTSYIVFQAVKKYDESHRETTAFGGTEDLMFRMARRIKEGNIDIPPIPDIMQKLHQYMQRDDTSVQDIVKLIMSDQILTSKILKVVNSAFYSPREEITSLQQAIILMGLKSILSIVTVHSLGGVTQKHSDKIKPVLQHSLICAFVAKKIAGVMHIDPEEAFVCGLLHDIGKTVLINLISEEAIQSESVDKLIADYHAGIGFMVATKWHLSEVVRTAIKFHHSPQSAQSFNKTVNTIYLANVIAKSKDIRDLIDALPENFSNIDFDRISEIYEEIDKIRDTASTII